MKDVKIVILYIFVEVIDMGMMKKFVLEEFQDDCEVIIYGAGLYGEITFKGLSSRGIKVYAFADQNVKIKEYLGIPVIHPTQIKEYENPKVFIASRNYMLEMANFLEHEGIEDYFEISEFLNRDAIQELSEYAKEVIYSKDKYTYLLDNNLEDKLVIDNIDLVVTQYCNLKCKDCGSLIPYYKIPSHLPYKDIILSFDKLLDAVDELLELRILGGEPFLYPYLKEVIYHYVENIKIHKITIYTNSTIIPKNSVLEAIKNPKVCIHMSNYGEISRCILEFSKKCDELGVKYVIHDYQDWRDMGGLELRNYTAEEVISIYKTCANAKCPSFYNGKLYICPRAANGEHIGAFKNKQCEYIDCSVLNVATNELRKQVNELLFERKVFSACYYCNGNNINNPPIKAAIQL